MSSSKESTAAVEVLRSALRQQGPKGVLVGVLPVQEYAGMVIFMQLYHRPEQDRFELNQDWISYGLDYKGSDWELGYLYAFPTLEVVLEYLERQFGLGPEDLPVEVPDTDLPNAYRDEVRRPEFMAAWDRFHADFSAGKLREPGVEVLYSDEEVQFLKPGEG